MLGTFIIFSLDSTVSPIEEQRSTKFTYKELSDIVGGRIQIVPAGDGNLFVVCEDGLCRNMPENPHVGDFVGQVLWTEAKLIKK